MTEILFLAAALLASVSRTPRRWLLALSVLGELWVILPPGIITLIVWLPWIIHRLLRRPGWTMAIGSNLQIVTWWLSAASPLTSPATLPLPWEAFTVTWPLLLAITFIVYFFWHEQQRA